MKKDSSIIYLSIDRLQRGKFQPRKDFEQESLKELAESISKHGIIEPIVVRKLGQEKYEIVAGERRWRAAQLAGLEEIPCLLKNYDEEDAAAVALIENLQRTDLNAIEEAQAYQSLKEIFCYTDEDIAQRVSKSRVKITNSLRLLKLPTEVKNAIQQGLLSSGHGKCLVGLTQHHQLNLAKESIEKGLSVRQLEQAIKKIQTITPNTEARKNNFAIAKALSDHIGCPVKIEFNENNGKGQVVFECHNLDVMEGLFAKMKFKYDEVD